MIVARRPFTIYDLDLAFLTGLVIMLVLGFTGLVRPWMQRQADASELQARLRVINTRLESQRANLASLADQIGQLRDGVELRSARIPTSSQRAEALQGLTAAARPYAIEFAVVTPQQPKMAEHRVTSDLKIRALGTTQAFVLWLDTLAREHPYVAIEYLKVSPIGNDAQRCQLDLQLRLHLLPENKEESSA